MAVSAGASTKVNTLKGFAKLVEVSASELVTLADKVFPANILLKESDGKIYLTDGVSKLSELKPIVDPAIAPLSATERGYITNVNTAGGVVVTDSNNKIDDGQLKMVAGGQIAQTYLSNFLGNDGKILLSALPDTVRAHITYVADIAARNALAADGEEVKGPVYVLDASADSTVDSGWAIYVATVTPASGDTPAAIASWTKIGEGESLDIDVDAIKCDYTNVQAAGAVMYDHPVVLEGLSLTEYNTLTAGA